MTIAKKTRKKYTYVCPNCKREHVRNMWSIAHADEEQSVKCACRRKLIIPAER